MPVNVLIQNTMNGKDEGHSSVYVMYHCDRKKNKPKKKINENLIRSRIEYERRQFKSNGFSLSRSAVKVNEIRRIYDGICNFSLCPLILLFNINSGDCSYSYMNDI